MSLWWPALATLLVCFLAWRGGAKLGGLLLVALLFFFGTAISVAYVAKKMGLEGQWAGLLCFVAIPLVYYWLVGWSTKSKPKR